MFFEDQNAIYIIDKKKGESFEYYYMKSLFLSKCNPQNFKEYNFYLKFSNIYCNINIRNCKYNKSILQILNNIIVTKNIYSK